MTGLIINSYNAQDGALTAMVVNDTIGINILFRERWPTLPYLFFESWALDQDFRTPYRLAFNIPRDPDQIDPERWRSPMGAGPIPQDHFTQKNFSGPVYFWDTFSHSGYRTDPLHKMGRWYREVMMEHIGSDF